MPLRPRLIESILHRMHLLPTPVLDAFGNVLFGRALSIAVRQGFFETLDGQPLSSEQIAAKLSLDAGAVEILAELFVLAGYLQRHEGFLALSPEGRRWLIKSSPQYLGNLVAYFESLYGRWAYLDHTLRYGKPPRPYYETFSAEDWRTYVYGMRDLARLLSPMVLKRVDLGKEPLSLLDIGGSHGLYAVECCRRYPGLHATIIDFAPALNFTSSLLAGEGMESRVRLLGGDFMKTEFPHDQHGAFLFNVIHGLGESENRELVGRALHSLKPGGKLYILDQLREEGRHAGVSRFMPLVVGLHLMNDIGGAAYRFEEVMSWCAMSRSVRRIRLRLPGVSLVEVVK